MLAQMAMRIFRWCLTMSPQEPPLNRAAFCSSAPEPWLLPVCCAASGNTNSFLSPWDCEKPEPKAPALLRIWTMDRGRRYSSRPWATSPSTGSWSRIRRTCATFAVTPVAMGYCSSSATHHAQKPRLPGTPRSPDISPSSPTAVIPNRRALLAAFPVTMLTAYDSASSEKYKWGRLDAQHLAATRDEFRRFTLELAKTPGRRIVSNWEFENDCPARQWLSCQEYYQARLDGILDGRKQAKALGYPGEVLTAFEFTIVPGFAGRPSGLVEVATKLKGIDFISYSCWWSIGSDAGASKVSQDFAYVVPLLRNFASGKKLTNRLKL